MPHSGQHAPRALRRRFAAPFGGFAASFAALRRCPCWDGTLRVLFFAACGGFIFVAAATNFAASREYACSASKNAGKSNAFAGISHKFLISFLYTCTRHNADNVTDTISAIGNASHTISTERVVTARTNAAGSSTPS